MTMTQTTLDQWEAHRTAVRKAALALERGRQEADEAKAKAEADIEAEDAYHADVVAGRRGHHAERELEIRKAAETARQELVDEPQKRLSPRKLDGPSRGKVSAAEAGLKAAEAAETAFVKQNATAFGRELTQLSEEALDEVFDHVRGWRELMHKDAHVRGLWSAAIAAWGEDRRSPARGLSMPPSPLQPVLEAIRSNLLTEAEARRARRPLPDLDAELLPATKEGFDGRAVELLAVPAQFLAAYAEGAETYELLEQIEADAKPEAVTA